MSNSQAAGVLERAAVFLSCCLCDLLHHSLHIYYCVVILQYPSLLVLSLVQPHLSTLLDDDSPYTQGFHSLTHSTRSSQAEEKNNNTTRGTASLPKKAIALAYVGWTKITSSNCNPARKEEWQQPTGKRAANGRVQWVIEGQSSLHQQYQHTTLDQQREGERLENAECFACSERGGGGGGGARREWRFQWQPVTIAGNGPSEPTDGPPDSFGTSFINQTHNTHNHLLAVCLPLLHIHSAPPPLALPAALLFPPVIH